MKKISLKRLIYLLGLLMFAGVLFTACEDDAVDDDDDDDDNPVLVEDGLYVTGAGTALVDLDFKGLMKTTRNEVGQEDRATLKEIYVAVKGGSEGFNIVEVAGQTQTSYGPGSDFAVVDSVARDIEEPAVDFWRGTYSVTETAFTVPNDGLYQIVMDTEVGIVAVVPVVYWGLIGAATPGGWSSDTEMPSTGFDLNSITYEATNVVMTKADFKFRHTGGWKIIIDGEDVRVNTNFGGTPADLVPGGDNIANDESGVYTVGMVWTLGEGFTANMNRTGDLNAIDYTDTELGLIGNSLVLDGAPHNWDSTLYVHKPVVEGETTYIWTFESVEVSANDTLGGFKIREGQTWDGYSFGYPQVTMAGLAEDLFETNNDGNFIPTEDGIFDVEFKIDALSEEFTFTVNPAGAAPELYILGDATSAGWDNTKALPMQGSDGNYTITTDFTVGGGFKFITDLGQWQPQYGTDATGTFASGPLFLNDGTGTDPANIPGPDAAGTYLVTVDTNGMTYTITAVTK